MGGFTRQHVNAAHHGNIRSFVGAERFTDDKLRTLGAFGVARFNYLQVLMRNTCTNNFEHHVAAYLVRLVSFYGKPWTIIWDGQHTFTLNKERNRREICSYNPPDSAEK